MGIPKAALSLFDPFLGGMIEFHDYFQALTRSLQRVQTKRSKRMSYSRVEGQSSTRPCPEVNDIPEWMLKQQ